MWDILKAQAVALRDFPKNHAFRVFLTALLSIVTAMCAVVAIANEKQGSVAALVHAGLTVLTCVVAHRGSAVVACVAAVLHGIVAIAIAVGVPVYFEYFMRDGAWLRALVVFLASATGAVVSGNFWSVRVVQGLHVDGARCEYCGSAGARLICPTCHSIQWTRLISHPYPNSTERWEQPFYRWATAVFVDHNRWKLLATGVGVVVVGSLTLGIQFQTELWKRDEDARKNQFERSRAIVDALTKYRSALLEYVACLNGHGKDCDQKRSEFIDAYYRFSWTAPSFLSELRMSCMKEAKYRSENYGRACCEVRLALVDARLDEFFFSALNVIYAPESDRVDVCNEAFRLHCEGRRVGCLIDVVSSSKGNLDAECDPCVSQGCGTVPAAWQALGCDDQVSTSPQARATLP